MVPVAVKRESVLVSRLFESERIVVRKLSLIMESVVSFGTTLGSYSAGGGGTNQILCTNIYNTLYYANAKDMQLRSRHCTERPRPVMY